MNIHSLSWVSNDKHSQSKYFKPNYIQNEAIVKSLAALIYFQTPGSMCCNLLCFKDSIIRKEILKILISARRNSKHIRRGHLQGVQAQTVCFSFYALFPPPTFYFAFLKRSLKVLQEAMSALQVIFSLPLNFNAHYPKLHLILLSLSLLSWLSCVTQAVAT